MAADQVFTVDDATPSRLLGLDDVQIGDAVEQAVNFDADMWRRFDALAGDAATVHRQTKAARAMGFEKPILQGLAVTTRFSRLIGMYLPGERAVLQSVEFRFRRPVFVPSMLVYRARIERILRPLSSIKMSLEIAVGGTTHVTGICQCVIR
jgi:3-hydroxybutyryl-CoA dehydratase